jgi:hypothetical protein
MLACEAMPYGMTVMDNRDKLNPLFDFPVVVKCREADDLMIE